MTQSTLNSTVQTRLFNLDPALEVNDTIQPQLDLMQSAFHLLFAAVTPKSPLRDMIAVSRVLAYTAEECNRLLDHGFPYSATETPIPDWDGIFDRIWNLELERPSAFLPH